MTEETTMEAPPKRRGRPPNAAKLPAPQEQAQSPVPQLKQALDYDEITYIPGDSDPTNTLIDYDPSRPESGLRFHANLPVKVRRTRTMKQLIVHKKTNADGNVVSIAVETDVPLVDVLRKNPKFSINGEKPFQQQKVVIQYDPDWYRGYAHKWITLSTNLRDMNERWDQEAQMREECGCSYEEIEYLQPKLDYMRKRLTLDV